MGQKWGHRAVYGLLLLTACTGTPTGDLPSRTESPAIVVLPMRDPPVALRRQLESEATAATDERELIAKGAVAGGVIGYGIGTLAALSCIMVPGCAPAIALAPAVIGGAATGAVVMGVATEISENRETGGNEVGQIATPPSNLAPNRFQQALALHTFQALEVAAHEKGGAGLHTVDRRLWPTFLEDGRPRASEILEQSLADRVLTVGIRTLSLDHSGRLRVYVSSTLRESDATRGGSSYLHNFVVLERRTASEWLAEDGRHLADVLVRSLPFIANRLVEERFMRVGAPPAVQPTGERPGGEWVELHWSLPSADDGDRREVDLIVRKGVAHGQCAGWLARVGRRTADNIDPPCLLNYQVGSLRGAVRSGEGRYTVVGLSPCTRYSWAARDRLAGARGPAVSEWSDWREFSTRCEGQGGGV